MGLAVEMENRQGPPAPVARPRAEQVIRPQHFSPVRDALVVQRPTRFSSLKCESGMCQRMGSSFAMALTPTQFTFFSHAVPSKPALVKHVVTCRRP